MLIIDILRKFQAAYRARKDPIAYARSIGVRVGNDCRFLGFGPATFGSEPFLISIGDHVTITSGVRFVTHDGGVWVFRQDYPDVDSFGPISVGDNVFIGINSIILPNVAIGSNSVVGAGSVVTKDIPANSVVAGVPARVIRDVTEYRERVLKTALHIRSMPRDRKREFLLTHFGPGDHTAP